MIEFATHVRHTLITWVEDKTKDLLCHVSIMKRSLCFCISVAPAFNKEGHSQLSSLVVILNMKFINPSHIDILNIPYEFALRWERYQTALLVHHNWPSVIRPPPAPLSVKLASAGAIGITDSTTYWRTRPNRIFYVWTDLSLISNKYETNYYVV